MSGVQAVINGEDRNVNNVCNTDPMLFTCDIEADIFISKSTKDTIWNLEYTGLSLLLQHNFNYQSVKYNFLSLADGKLIMHLINKPLKVKQFDSIDIWTDTFINNANVMIEKHPLLAGYLLSYMSIISGYVVDASFNSADQYDQQFRLRIAYNQTRTWSQIDGNIWLQFIAKGALGNRSSTAAQFPVSSQKPRYDFSFKKGCFKTNCLFKHSCIKCGGMHSSAIFNKCKQTNSIKTSYKASPFNKYSADVCTPLLNNPGRGLNKYDILQLGYSPINLNELYIALEKYPRKDIAKLQKMDLHLVSR